MSDLEIWFKSADYPDELSKAQNGFSVDVLAYNKRTDENTIAWFDYNKMRWLFLSNEDFKPFKWRYINPETDKF